ncbi:cyclic nucleotide-binding protein [Legionella beliardensis]|uniref:Cyclic nucleotide-binding protein n=1 Tax=Legionella beliardensis TaxID=91822 RepID=A0A378I0T5_9GAMM|nr:cyclic nucleotide-binding domain-containing protein [Legionella beliardensis]STX28593.1 cyclic nucleotide-binding protein [Legionella beliardensis]
MNNLSTKVEPLKTLQSSPLFSKLSKGILWRIASLVQERSFETGDYLMKQGEKGDSCFIISRGRVEIFYEIDNKKITISEVGAGEILGELAIIDGLPRSASVIAIEPTETLTISEWDFKAQLQAYPEIALQLLPLIAQRLRHTQNQLIKLNQQ